MTKEKIYNILRSHTNTVNSFVDDAGHNHFMDCVNDIFDSFDLHSGISGSELRAKRRAADITQKDLAAAVGKTKTWLSKVENNARKASDDDIEVMLKVIASSL